MSVLWEIWEKTENERNVRTHGVWRAAEQKVCKNTMCTQWKGGVSRPITPQYLTGGYTSRPKTPQYQQHQGLARK